MNQKRDAKQSALHCAHGNQCRDLARQIPAQQRRGRAGTQYRTYLAISLLAGNVSSGLEPISKTINVPENLDFEAFCSLYYEEAYALGLKGCTTFRPNPVTGSVLTPRAMTEAPAHCCGIEREAD